jgi:hypothetical protein
MWLEASGPTDLIKKEDIRGWEADERTGDGNALPLTSTQLTSPFTDTRVVLFWEFGNERSSA